MRALQNGSQFKVRVGPSETLQSAFAGAHGVFLCLCAGAGRGRRKQALEGDKEAGVQHFIWSTLRTWKISGGKLDVPHFTNKAERSHREGLDSRTTFVIAPFFYQNLVGAMAPQKQADGTLGWALPLDPKPRVLHMGDITELGYIVVGAFLQQRAGRGEYLPLVGDFLRLQ